MSSEENVNIIILNDPLVARSVSLKGCWLFVWRFSNVSVVSSPKKVVVCLDLFFCQNYVFVREKSVTVWGQSFMKTISNYFCVIFPHEFCLYCRCCRTLEKFFTIEPERRSIDALIVFIFFHLMTAQSTFLDQCLLFWKPSSSFTIDVINPKSCLSAFAPPIVKNLFFLAEKSTRFHFQSKSISIVHLPISRAICFDFES